MAIEKDGYGLNKSARLKALREAQREEERKQSLPLDPDFPYDPLSFDPFYFDVAPSIEQT